MSLKRFLFALTCLISTAVVGCAGMKRSGPPMATIAGNTGAFGIGHILDLEAGTHIPFDQFIDRLAGRDLVFIGEIHDNPEHHLLQVQILQALAKRWGPLTMAMEFFQKPSQEALDRYVGGETSESDFLREVDWKKSWGYDYHLYRPLLLFAREKGIKVLAINAPRPIVQKVARGGLRSLTEAERRQVASEMHFTDEAHREYLSRAYKEHAHRDLKRFDDFYEAQCAWEETMAESLAVHLKEKGGKLVVLAGNGHIIYRFGIPERTLRRVPVSMATVLPYPLEEKMEVNRGAADFVWLTAGYPHRFTRSLTRMKSEP